MRIAGRALQRFVSLRFLSAFAASSCGELGASVAGNWILDPLDPFGRIDPPVAPTGARVEAVLDEFEKTAWAGLEPDRYSWTAVLNRPHGGEIHVHVLTPRVAWRRAGPEPEHRHAPGWAETFDPLRDAINHTCGWSRPDHPARAGRSNPAIASTLRRRICGPA